MRPVPLILGVVTLAAAWASLLDGHSTFFGHMTAHMAVVAVAAPLLAIAIARSSWDPVSRAPALFSPLLASLLELVVVWAWHTPVLHELARQSAGALVLEQASFLIAGLFLWISVTGGDIESRRGAGIAALLLTAIHMTLLGALLALAPRPLYAHVHLADGLSALEDQHLGGAIMILVGGTSYLLGGLWLSWGLLRYRSVINATCREMPPDPGRRSV